MPFKSLSLPVTVLSIVRDKATERPFSGEYEQSTLSGTYLCRQCGIALFRGNNQFHSGCGWPSFDDAVTANVKVIGDADGIREEIVCIRCNAHLGHIFKGEGFTPKNIRHCVNSLSLDFVTNKNVEDTEEAIFAAGCFWGVEYLFKQLPGVIKTEVGYIGGSKESPTYDDVCTGSSAYIEAVRVIYQPEVLNYTELAKYFFEIHDPSQINGQGPDIGEQYKSVIYYYNAVQQNAAQLLIAILVQQGCKVATEIVPVSVFWRAESYHQQYYTKANKQPYCHHYVKRFL